MRRLLLVPLLLALSVAAPGLSAPDGDDRTRLRVIETEPLHIDRLYSSMAGPYSRKVIDTTGLDFVTSLRTEVIDANNGEPMGEEFFCHSQLQLPNRETTRLMVTATGSAEIRFPAGFAMPVNEILLGLPAELREVSFIGMVLNNHEKRIDRWARVRTTIEYMTAHDVGDQPPRRLYKVGLPMTVEDRQAYAAPEAHDDVTTHCVLVEGLKGHWIVEPGTQKTRKKFENIVPVPATVHFAAAHLHNYGVYVKLTDLTTGETLWRADPAYEKNRKQIRSIPIYSSPAGFAIHPDHVYEFEAYYDNTTNHDIDAMALVDLYYHPVGGERITYSPE